MGGILAVIAGWLSTFLSSQAARFFALKVLLTALVMTVLPVVLNNLLVHILEILYSHVNATFADAGFTSVVLRLSGLAGFLALHLHLPDVFSVLFSAIALRITFKLIPFLNF